MFDYEDWPPERASASGEEITREEIRVFGPRLERIAELVLRFADRPFETREGRLGALMTTALLIEAAAREGGSP